MLVLFEDDLCIRAWQGRLGVSGSAALRTFKAFHREVLMETEPFKGLGPSELVEWQVNARGRDSYRIKSLAQQWINQQPLRVSTKTTRLSHISSFFLHNHAPLPDDPSFHFTSDVSPVEGKLDVESFKRILHNSNKLYRAIFLTMAHGLLDESGLVHVNTKCCNLILESLTKNVGVFKLTLPGRKMNRNVKNFYTLLSTRSDWATAMRDYLKSLSYIPRDVLFKNKHGEPLTQKNIQYYFHWRAVEAGVIEQFTPKCSHCDGITVRVRRHHPSGIVKVGYKCKECENLDWACDLKLNLTNIRYGVNPHEIRDLMRSRWGPSGAKLVVAEFIMGHNIDPNEYHKMEYTPTYPIQEYRKALPWLNVLSCDPNKVDRTEVDSKLEASEAKVDVLSRELASVKAKIRILDDPMLVEVLEEKLREMKKKKETKL